MICKACGGWGYLERYDYEDDFEYDNECPDCGGTGNEIGDDE